MRPRHLVVDEDECVVRVLPGVVLMLLAWRRKCVSAASREDHEADGYDAGRRTKSTSIARYSVQLGN